MAVLLAVAGVLSAPRSVDAQEAAPRIGIEVNVERALKVQGSVLKTKEHLSADPDLLEKIGRAPGQQVRVYRGPDDFAAYTVSEGREEEPESTVRIGLKGRRRLGVSDPFEARIVSTVPRSDLSDEEARSLGEIVERLKGDGASAGLLIMAPHGGDIEKHTAEEAERLYETLKSKDKPVVCWMIKAYGTRGGQRASTRWHITATDLSEASYPLLGQVANRTYTYSVSFHGMSGEGLLIGGAAPMALREEVKAALERKLAGTGVPIRIAGAKNRIGGHSRRNIVNRYCVDNGIQIEQGGAARREHWKTVADTIAEVYGPKL